jgi:hypothetical protein
MQLGQKKNTYKILVGKPLGKPRRWQDNMTMHLKKIIYQCEEQTGLTRDHMQLWALVLAI